MGNVLTHRATWVLATAAVLLLSCRTARRNAATPTPPDFSAPANPIVAHRGAWKALSLPQNSLAALRHAVALGCAGSEFDVRMSADDSLVVTHDADYAGLVIEESTYAQLAATELPNGETLPTLRDYIVEGLCQNRLAVQRGAAPTTLVCEIKPSGAGPERGRRIAQAAVALVKELGARDQTLYISFGYAICREIVRLDPNAHVQYLNGDKAPTELAADGFAGLDYHFSAFREHPEWIAEAKGLGLALNAWTVNDPGDIEWLLGEGFTYITTNEPELVARLRQ